MTGRQIAKAVFFLGDFHSLSAPWFTGHSWTLAVEEQFYLFFPATLLLTPRRWRSAVCGGIGILGIALMFSISLSGWNTLLSAGVSGGFVCISCGVMVGIHEDKLRALAQRTPVALVLLAAVMVLLHPFADLNDWKMALYQALAVPPAIAVLLLSTMEQQSWFRSLLCWRPVQAVGVTSYGLYLWQQLFMGRREVYSGLGHFIPFLSPLLCVIVPFSWFLVEKPAMVLGANLSRRVRRRPDTLKAAV